jgi:hypothetical protein
VLSVTLQQCPAVLKGRYNQHQQRAVPAVVSETTQRMPTLCRIVALFCLAVCNVHLLHLHRAYCSVTDGEGCVLFWPTNIFSKVQSVSTR